MSDQNTDTSQEDELQELREKARQFDTLMGNLNGMAYRCLNDREWTMTYVSAGARALTGYGPEDLVDNRLIAFGDLICEQDQSMVWKTIQDAIAAGDRYTMQYRICDAEGNEKWVWEQGCAVKDEAGRIIALEGFITDISVLKHTEQTLKKREETYRNYVENAPHGIFVADGEGQYIEVNRAASRITGYTRDELLAMHITDFSIHPEAEQARAHFQQVANEGTSSGVAQFRRKDGSTGWWSVDAVRLDDDRYIGFTSDVSELTRLDGELRKREADLRRAQEVAHVGSWQFDFTVKEVHTSEEARRIYGLPEGVVTIADVQKIALPEYRSMLDRAMIGLTHHNRPYDVEFQIKRPTDEAIVDIHSVAHYNHERNIVYGTIQDVTERKTAERDLRASENRYRLLADNTLDVIWLMDLTTRFTYVNSAVTEMFGYTPEEFIGTLLADHCDDEQLAVMLGIIEYELSNLGEHKGVIFEAVMNHRDGTPRWIEIHGALLFDKDGRPTGLQGTTRDISERKRMEETLRQSEERYRTYISNIHDVIVILDEDLKVTYKSPNITRHFGWLPEDLISHDGWETVHPGDREYIARELMALLEHEGNTGTVQYRYLCKDGSYTYIELVAVNMINDPIIRGILGNYHDITEQRESEMAIRESEEKFRLAFKTSPDSVNINKLDGTYVDINDGFTLLTGYSEADVMGKTSTEIDIWVKPEDRQTLVAGLKENGSVANLQSEFRCKDGSIKTAIMSASIIMVNHEPHILSITRDITERIRLEEQLRHAQKMEAVGRLAGGVAHDFNNMLNVILGNAEIILSSLEENSELYEDIQEIIKAGQRSAGLTRQLLAFSRKQIISPKIVNINQIITEQKQMLIRMIGEDIEIITNLADDLWSVRIDPSQVDQILANLLVNARDAISDVGTVTIETGNVTVDKTYSEWDTFAKTGDYVILACTDSGTGMDEAVRERIFEPFFTTKGEGQGTGLGLATVYGIVKQNDGIINVYSEPGTGTVFRVYFPRSTSTRPVAEQPKKEMVLSGTETVLVVEDEPQILNLAEKVLSRYGYTVIAANTVLDAIAQASSYPERIHLLLTDVVMPNMNGKELKSHIEAVESGIKTLFMSGYTAEVIAHRGVIEEGVEFIQKPFSTKELLAKVRHVLDL